MNERNTTLIAGCPGAGKTTTLLGLIEQELERGTPPDRIGFLTFTRKARLEAVERAQRRFGLSPRDLPYFLTIHALGFHQLGLKTEQVLDVKHYEALSDYVGVPVTGKMAMAEGMVSAKNIGDRLMFHANLARVRGLSLREHYEETNEDFTFEQLEHFARGLQEFKRANDLFDYTDMLALLAAEAPSPLLDVLFVDEAQDLSRLQWDAVRKLAARVREVVVAGDDDQAIFRWAGADVAAFIGLPAKVQVLEQSYRVPRAVQGLAVDLVARLSSRRDKRWNPRDEDGEVLRYPDFWQLDMTEGEWLVLARNQYMLNDVQGMLRSEGLIYERFERSSVDPKLLETIKSWEALRVGRPIPLEAAVPIYRQMTAGRGYGKGGRAMLESELILNPQLRVGLSLLKERFSLRTEAIWHEALDRIPLEDREYLIAALRRGEKLGKRPRIRLSTIHGAKGGEADHVALLTDMAWRPYKSMREQPDDETRVFYVGVTRARQALHVVAPRSGRHFDL